MALSPYYDPVRYSIEKRPFFRFNFLGIEKVQINYSQLHQDMFVLTALNGMRDGTYLEIGANEPILNSNTFLLEHFFDWKGVSLEISTEHVSRFKSHRKNECLLQDATTADYERILLERNFPKVIDYLSVDCEPSSHTFESLVRIPHNKYRFRVITFEHDFWAATLTRDVNEMAIREKSRSFLSSLGYRMIVSDVSWFDRPSEDWWVDPSSVSDETIRVLLGQQKNDHIDYMYRS